MIGFYMLHGKDKSMIRNILTYKLSNDLGKYAPRAKLIELYLNDEYRGVYVLMEKIKEMQKSRYIKIKSR